MRSVSKRSVTRFRAYFLSEVCPDKTIHEQTRKILVSFGVISKDVPVDISLFLQDYIGPRRTRSPQVL